MPLDRDEVIDHWVEDTYAGSSTERSILHAPMSMDQAGVAGDDHTAHWRVVECLVTMSVAGTFKLQAQTAAGVVRDLMQAVNVQATGQVRIPIRVNVLPGEDVLYTSTGGGNITVLVGGRVMQNGPSRLLDPV